MMGKPREVAMKQSPLLFHAAMVGLFLFACCAYADSLDDEAKKAIFDYYKRRHALTLCGDSAYISTLSTGKLRIWGSFQMPVDSFREPLAVIGWPSQP